MVMQEIPCFVIDPSGELLPGMKINEAVRRIAAEDRHFLRHLSLQSLPSLSHFLERDPYRPQLGIKNLPPFSAEETDGAKK
jgi:hypothetical protein